MLGLRSSFMFWSHTAAGRQHAYKMSKSMGERKYVLLDVEIVVYNGTLQGIAFDQLKYC